MRLCLLQVCEHFIKVGIIAVLGCNIIYTSYHHSLNTINYPTFTALDCGLSTVVQCTSGNQEVCGSNPQGCWYSISILSLSDVPLKRSLEEEENSSDFSIKSDLALLLGANQSLCAPNQLKSTLELSNRETTSILVGLLLNELNFFLVGPFRFFFHK